MLINEAFDKSSDIDAGEDNLNWKVSFSWKMSIADIIVYQLQTNFIIYYASLNRNTGSMHISSYAVNHLQALGE